MSGSPQSHTSSNHSRHSSRHGSRPSSRASQATRAGTAAAGDNAEQQQQQQQAADEAASALPLPPQIPPAQQAAMAFSGTGFNARWGPDMGLPPQFAPRGMMAGYPMGMYPQQAASAMPYTLAGAGMPQYGGGGYGRGVGGFYGGGAMHTPVMTAGGGVVNHGLAAPMMGGVGAPGPRPLMTPAGRPQYPYPIISADNPSVNMTNSTGGVGCEPGYDYFFPPEHTKIHFLKTGPTPPWQLPPGTHIEFTAAHVPCNITIGELMKGFGANNPNPQLNVVTEAICTGNGNWYRGMSFVGEVPGDMAKTLKSVGWDSTRNGLPGGSPVVYLYITKD
ncbi:hypothetical protein GGTG_02508 [Gaeumannomyces tritici R3-111a-1]|uniref:Uncharacterized protein n=1 Tax=Gaeumannomyces tritici (strain R3-111a-1) TaxID=644352 RepID=J3NMK2_GAET3|nr:hypothetical protein GGTG_02508 [Gaeumannomyces tritici R3-111a-1]EJT82535.1 hypothetical protein GGTG_02508 [Gaeumannomyces tritici R3-111a-1]